MPTDKRSKEQTWKEDELKQSLKEINGERSHSKSRRDKHRDEHKVDKESSHSQRKRDERDREDDRRDREKRREYERRSEKSDSDIKMKSDRDGDHKSKAHRDDRGHKDRDRHQQDVDGDRRRNHADVERKEKRRDELHQSSNRSDDKERQHGGNDDRERRHRDKDDRERRHRDDGDRDSKHRDDKEKKYGNEEGSNERKHGDDRKQSDRDAKHRDRDRERGDRERGDQDKEHGARDNRQRDRENRDRDKGHRDRDREHKYREHRDRDTRHKEYGREHGDKERGDQEKDRGNRDRDREDRDKGHRDRDGKHRDRDREPGNREDKDRDRRHKDSDREHGDRDKERGDRDRERYGKESRHDRADRERRDKMGNGDTKRREGDREQIHREEEQSRKDNSQSGRSKDKESRRKDKARGHEEAEDETLVKEHRERKGHDKEHRQRGDVDTEKKHDDRSRTERKNREDIGDGEERKRTKKSHSGNNYSKDVEEDEVAYEVPAKSTSDTQNEDDYAEYADDFEDYDDDFEDDDDKDDSMIEHVNKMNSRAPKSSNSEMEALYDALNAENEKLLADSRSNLTDGSETPDERYDQRKSADTKPRGFINFVAAKQRDMNQKVASKARKRCAELLNIIELDTVNMSLFDLPPVNEYDLYMSSFGRTNAQQAYVQTNEDNLERDTQTEEIDCTSKWTQHPSEGTIACGADDKGESEGGVLSKHDEGKLTSFLQRTCQVIERLWYEEDTKNLYKNTSSHFSCSEASFDLVAVEVFRSREVSRCQFSPTDSNIILTMHTGPMQAVDRKLDKYGMIGVWNTNDPSKPQKIVASAGMPMCCCFSPIKATLVFGGMRDGSLVAWDLREPPTMHHSYMCGKKDWLLRFPTYNTAGVLKYDNHNSPITALVPILMDSSKSVSQDSGLGLSFQLATLDKNGTVNLWVVAEILETSIAGSESDLGLSPNGKIKLLKSSTVTLYNPAKNYDLSSLCTVDLKLNPSNHNHLYVATDAGMIIHGTRFGTQKVSPRCYIGGDLTPCTVNSIDLHPFGHPLMLAGCEDGSLKLYHLSSESPIIVWEKSTSGAAIRRVLWSKNCSYILFVLDANSTIHMWDLLRNDAEPMTSDSMSRSNVEVTDICLSGECVQSRPKMVVSYSDGAVQVHLLSGHVSNLQPGEDDQFTRFIEHL